MKTNVGESIRPLCKGKRSVEGACSADMLSITFDIKIVIRYHQIR